MLNISKGSKTIFLVSTMLGLLFCNANISSAQTIADMQDTETTEEKKDTPETPPVSTNKCNEKKVLQFLKDNWRLLAPVVIPLLMLVAQPAGYLASSAAFRTCPITWGKLLTSAGALCAILASLNITPPALKAFARFIGYASEWADGEATL